MYALCDVHRIELSGKLFLMHHWIGVDDKRPKST